jgi:hypothetical protein
VQVDREVSIEKYHRELSVLRSQAGALARLGCYVVHAEFPTIEAVVLPTRCMAFGLPMPEAAEKSEAPARPLAAGELQCQLLILPFAFTAMPFGIRVNLEDFDLRAPSYTFHHPTTWELLPHNLLPQASLLVQGKSMLVMLGGHPVTKGAFFCMRGVREYHEHPEHTGDEWLLYRGSVNVFSTLTTIVRCCCKNVVPIAVFTSTQLIIQWTL